MATYEELKEFTHGELSSFTHDQLNRLTLDELLAIAESKIEIVSKNNPELSKTLRSTLAIISLNIASDVIYDAAKTVSWSATLEQFILFVQSFLR